MFSKLFASKLEKELIALQERGRELEVRYENGESLSVSLLMKVFRNQVVILGFSELKSKTLQCTFLHNGASFKTTVQKRGLDSNGNNMFFCSFPEKVEYKRGFQRYVISGKDSSCKVLVTTRQGDKSLVMPIWEISEMGTVLLNKTKVHLKIGTSLFQTMMTVGGVAGKLVDMKVAGQQPHPEGQMLICAFTSEPRGLSEMLSAGKSLAPKPKPPAKKK